MSWRESAENAVRELREEGIEQTANDIREEYVIDQRELGKMITIASLALMVASIPSAITMQSAKEDIGQVNQDLTQIQSVVSSDDFRNNLETLQNRIGGNVATTLGRVMEGMEQTNQSINNLEATQERLDSRAETFRWLSLISILGVVAGATTMYI